MIKVSVVIPVYNVEKFISKCVHSLMRQTLKEMEFIFVSDCTPDASVGIIREVIDLYPERTSQVVIIENFSHQGTSETRKRGTCASRGEYVGYCDADDWVEPLMFEKLYDAAKNDNSDIALCDFVKDFEQSHEVHSFEYPATPALCLQQAYNRKKFSYNIWHQLIKRDIAVDSLNRVYPTSYSEDVFSLFYAYIRAKNIAYVPEVLYHYNQCNPSSMMTKRRYSESLWRNICKNIDDIVSSLNQESCEQYYIACQWLKFTRKISCRSVFCNLHDYYNIYKESHREIMRYESIEYNVRRKYRIIYSSYLIFWLYENVYSRIISK